LKPLKTAGRCGALGQNWGARGLSRSVVILHGQ
jgi:hypothetical protein